MRFRDLIATVKSKLEIWTVDFAHRRIGNRSFTSLVNNDNENPEIAICDFDDLIAAVKSRRDWDHPLVDRRLHRSFGDRGFNMQRIQCNENPDFAICELPTESAPSDQHVI
jgi:hypothetical protein